MKDVDVHAKNEREHVDDDTIVIHLPHLSKAQMKEVVASIIHFMNDRWPDFGSNRFST